MRYKKGAGRLWSLATYTALGFWACPTRIVENTSRMRPVLLKCKLPLQI